MKKIITFVVMAFISSISLAETGQGIVDEINVERGYIVINNIKYNIQHGKTLFVSGNNSVDLGLLKRGSAVTFSSDDSTITKIIHSAPADS